MIDFAGDAETLMLKLLKPRVRGVTVEDMNEAIREAAAGER